MNRSKVKTIAGLFLITCLVSFAGAPAARAGLDRADGLTGVQDSPNGFLANTSFSWVDITSSGEALSIDDWVNSSGENKDDEGHATVALPWPFPWFGDSYSDVHIDANGNVGFEDWTEDTWRSDNRIPSESQPNNRIAAFYEDMAGPDTGACDGNEGAVYTDYDENADRFVIEYFKWCSWDGHDPGAPDRILLNTFEVILFPDGRVWVQYLEMPSAPANLEFGNPPGLSTVGLEGPDGEAGLIWEGATQAGMAWLYQPNGSIGSNRLYLPLIR